MRLSFFIASLSRAGDLTPRNFIAAIDIVSTACYCGTRQDSSYPSSRFVPSTLSGDCHEL